MNVDIVKNILRARIRMYAHGISKLIKRCGISSGAMYTLMDDETNPRLGTVIKVCEQLGLELIVREKQ